ncbi:MAG: AgmX/PglI C-terminal domain-containing protein [Deltaproteobacteria bacterium]|nr:AgmX/PglI C-terminal domain-containing protein [Deltaproteobacteria bacterium]
MRGCAVAVVVVVVRAPARRSARPEPPPAMRARAAILSLLLCAGVRALPPAPIEFSESGDFNVERFRPALDRNGILDVESGGIGPHLSFDATLWTGYALNPLVLVTTDENGARRVDGLVAHRLGANVTGAVSVFGWIELGVDVPLVLVQARDAAAFESSLQAVDTGAVGIGDLRLAPKLRLLRQRDAVVDVAVIPAVVLPTAFPVHSYFGDAGMGFVPEIAVSTVQGPVRIAVNAALRLRPETRFLNLQIGPEIVTRAGVAWKPEGPIELAISASGVTSLRDPMDRFSSGFELLAGASYELPLGVQVFGEMGMSPNAVFGMPTSRALLGVRFAPRVFDVDEDGVADEADQCAAEPEDPDGLDDTDGCPESDSDGDDVVDLADRCPQQAEDRDDFEDQDGCVDDDNDGDGVLDLHDGCPDQREDPDGDRDADGCPEEPLDTDKDNIADVEDQCPEVAGLYMYGGCPKPDADQDGVADVDDRCLDHAGPARLGGCPDEDRDGVFDEVDQCAREPETINGKKDDDGCPDKGAGKVTLRDGQLRLAEAIAFDLGKATLQKKSDDVLRQVAATLKAHTEVTRLRIDSYAGPGGAATALTLSRLRVAAVRDRLVQNGVAAGRLEIEGFGASKRERIELTIAELDGRRVVDASSGTAGTKAGTGKGIPGPAVSNVGGAGGADPREIASLIRDRLDGLRSCVEEAAKVGVMPPGRQILVVTIEADGSVSKARFKEGRTEGSPVGACIRGMARRWKFPPFDGAASDVEVPLFLSISN